MTTEQIEAHEESGEDMHIPTPGIRKQTKRLGKLAEFSECAICGAKIVASVIDPELWLEV